MESTEVASGVRKGKKKPVKDELDRLKQAEKKKRRLEKALATSAAIRSELEKKKEKKKEEQQRLDAEGAAIAEAVALNVLLGEDSEDSCKIMMNNNEEFIPWDCTNGIDLFMGPRRVLFPHQDLSKYTLEGIKLNPWEHGHFSVSPGPFVGNLYAPYPDERGWETREISADLIAAQAVASLQIADDARVDSYFVNGMLEG